VALRSSAQCTKKPALANLRAAAPIQAPVLYVRGSRDPLASGNPENEFKQLAEHFSFEVFDGGHWLALEGSDWLNQRLEQFFISLGN
jgi:surfactin synthase thioesterase subunit